MSAEHITTIDRGVNLSEASFARVAGKVNQSWPYVEEAMRKEEGDCPFADFSRRCSNSLLRLSSNDGDLNDPAAAEENILSWADSNLHFMYSYPEVNRRGLDYSYFHRVAALLVETRYLYNRSVQNGEPQTISTYTDSLSQSFRGRYYNGQDNLRDYGELFYAFGGMDYDPEQYKGVYSPVHVPRFAGRVKYIKETKELLDAHKRLSPDVRQYLESLHIPRTDLNYYQYFLINQGINETEQRRGMMETAGDYDRFIHKFGLRLERTKQAILQNSTEPLAAPSSRRYGYDASTVEQVQKTRRVRARNMLAELSGMEEGNHSKHSQIFHPELEVYRDVLTGLLEQDEIYFSFSGYRGMAEGLFDKHIAANLNGLGDSTFFRQQYPVTRRGFDESTVSNIASILLDATKAQRLVDNKKRAGLFMRDRMVSLRLIHEPQFLENYLSQVIYAIQDEPRQIKLAREWDTTINAVSGVRRFFMMDAFLSGMDERRGRIVAGILHKDQDIIRKVKADGFDDPMILDKARYAWEVLYPIAKPHGEHVRSNQRQRNEVVRLSLESLLEGRRFNFTRFLMATRALGYEGRQVAYRVTDDDFDQSLQYTVYSEFMRVVLQRPAKDPVLTGQ